MVFDPNAYVVPIISAFASAFATWSVSKFDLLEWHGLKQYKGTWYAYYRDPDNDHSIQREIWEFGNLGAVTVSRNGVQTFKGRLSLIGKKAYMNVRSTISRGEALFVLLNAPTNPRGSKRPSICVWMGDDESSTTTAGHGLLSRSELSDPEVRDEFLRAMAIKITTMP